VRNGVRLFAIALAVAIGFSAIGCSGSENDGTVPIYGAGYGYPAYRAQAADAGTSLIVTINISGIPDRYESWNGTISLWDDLGEGLGGSVRVVMDNAMIFAFVGNPGIFDGIMSVWEGDRDRHLRIWSRRLVPGANTILFDEFEDFDEVGEFVY